MPNTIEKPYLEILQWLESESAGDIEDMDYSQLNDCLKKVRRELQRLQHEADAISFKIHLARALSIHLRSRQRAMDEAEVER